MIVAKAGKKSYFLLKLSIVIGAYKKALLRNDKQKIVNEYLTFG